MLHSSERIIKHKFGLLNLAEEPCNVSWACKVIGLSQDTFYRYRKAIEKGSMKLCWTLTEAYVWVQEKKKVL